MRWFAWWPVLVGIAATPFALKTAEVLPLLGTAGLHRLCLLFPFAMLAQLHTFGFGESVSQAMMYLQFPVYGLILTLLQRVHSLVAGVLTVVCLHLIGAAAAWGLVLSR